MLDLLFPKDVIEKKLAEVNRIDGKIYGHLLSRIDYYPVQRLKKTARQMLRRCLSQGFLAELKNRKGIDEIISEINRPSAKKKILYVSVIPTFNLQRQSAHLRKTGQFETVLLTETPWLADSMAPYFDALYVYNSRYDLARILSRARPYLIHAQGAMGSSDYYGVLASLLGRSPTVFEFYDVQTLALARDDAVELYGEIDADLSIFSEKFVFNKCAGVIVGYSQDACRMLKQRYNSSVPVLEFHNYVCDDFICDGAEKYSAKDGKIHLVYGGNVAPSHLPQRLFGDVQFHGLIDKVTSQGICFDIFHSPHLSRIRAKQFLADYIELSQANPLFNLRHGLAPDVATREFAKYDFGAMIYLFDRGTFLKIHNDMRLPGKIFTYLEAGLPIIISEELSYPARIVRDYEIGIVVSQRDLEHLPAIIGSCDLDKLRANVRQARQELSMARHIGRLVQFYDQITAAQTPDSNSPQMCATHLHR